MVRSLRAGPVRHRPVGDGLLDRRRELVAEEVVDAPHHAHRVGDEVAVVHVVEALLADAGTRRDGLFDTDAQVVRHLTSEPVQVELRRAVGEDRRHQARPRRHRLHRVAVGHHEARVGIGRQDRLEVEVVVRRLEQPEVRRASRLQQLDHPSVVRVGRGRVGRAPPLVVPVHRHRVLLSVHRHAEQPGVLHRRVGVVEVHRLELRRQLLVLADQLQTTVVGRLTGEAWAADTAAPAPTGAGCGTAGRATTCWPARSCRCAGAR